MRVALWVLFLNACGPGLNAKATKSAARDALIAATTDVGKMTALLGKGVVNGGVWFEDASCASRFPEGEVPPTLRGEFARCLVGLRLEPSTRTDALGDVEVLTYGPGFELEARVAQNLDGPGALTWVGYASKRAKDALPSISSAALERLRITGDRNGPIDPAVGDTFEREAIPRGTPDPRNVDPATKFAFTWLKICLDETGDISEVDPFLTTSTEAEARFVAAAKQWTFRPFTIGGQPMPVCAMARLVYPAAAASEPEVLPMPPPLSRSKKRPRMLSNPRLIEGRRIAGATNIIPDDETKTAIQRAGAPTLQGTFRVCLDDTGVVESVLPLQSTGVSRYDTQLIAHMRAWRYSPYLVNDEPVPVCTYVTFIYSQR